MSLVSKIRVLILKLSRKFHHLKKNVKLNHTWYGNTYGGFYIYPDLLDENSIIYSFGIGEDISFDKALIEKHNCNIYGFDPTPKSINWIKGQNLPKEFCFYEFGISDKSGNVDFYLHKIRFYIF
jgi:hypothetical protein